MSMVDTFDERLVPNCMLMARLTEGTDYTVSVDGQKVTVDIRIY